MIRSFQDKKVEAVAAGRAPKGFPPDLVATARRKLKWVDAAADLRDLKSPPGNRLEALVGNPGGQHSIRTNDQWRIYFRWSDSGADDVEIVDYH